MKQTLKTFIACMLLLACSIGFFVGSTCYAPYVIQKSFPSFGPPEFGPEQGPGFEGKPPFEKPMCPFMKKHHSKGPHPEFGEMGPKGPRPDFEGKGPPPGFDKKGPRPDGSFKAFRHKMKEDMAEIDSILQVTEEQKAALNENRAKMDSAFKAHGEKKMNAEKVLRKALDSKDPQQINEAKKLVLAAHEAALNQRIEAVASLSKILTQEQLEKFRTYRENHFKKVREEN